MNIHDTISIREAKETEHLLNQAAKYIYVTGFLYKWGAGVNAISTEACLKQHTYVCKEFNLTNKGFGVAWKRAEQLQRDEDAAEKAFLSNHPELNP